MADNVNNGLPYYPRYPRDFIEGTIGMPFEEKAAYSLVLDLIYMRNGQLPDDGRYIAGLLGLSVRKWNALREKLLRREKLQAIDGYLTNYRAITELKKLRKFSEKQSENRRGDSKNKELEKPRSNHTDIDTDITPPPPSSRESVPPTKSKPESPSAEPVPDPLDIPEFLDRRRKPEAAQLDLAPEPPPEPDKARGSRLPDDWQPGPDARTFAHSQGLTDAEIDSVAERFRDHWHGKSGAAARKASWLATWRNWIRSDIDRGRVGAGASRGKPAAGSRTGGDGAEDRSFAASLARAAERQAAGSAPKRGPG